MTHLQPNTNSSISVPRGGGDALDGARGLAVLLVFLSHTSGREMALTPWLQFQGIGHVGVYLFFVLSAYLLTKNLLADFDPVKFYLRRFFRIAPLYYVVLVSIIIFQLDGSFTPDYLHISKGEELTHFLFYRGDGVFWTIAAEYSFYWLLPPMVLLVNKYGLNWLIIFATLYFILFCSNWLGFLSFPLKIVDIEGHRSQYLDVFACGVLAAYVKFKLPERATALIFFGCVGVTLALVSANFLNAGQPLYHLRWLSIFYGLVFAAGILSADQGNPWITRILKNKPLAFVGKCAFGWYLLHFSVLYILNLYGPNSPVVKFFLALIICFLGAALARIYIEQPFIKLGRKLENFFPRPKWF